LRNVESSVVVDRQPDVVLSAFTDPLHLKNWWGVDRSLIDLKKGGIYSLVWQKSDNALEYISTGIVAEYLPGCQLKIENMVYINPQRPIFGPMTLMVLTTPEKVGTTLTIVQSGYQFGPDWNWYYNIVKETWPMVILKIKQYVETLKD
jgi:uncharacterized protein YndB with AHSA1/START domain